MLAHIFFRSETLCANVGAWTHQADMTVAAIYAAARNIFGTGLFAVTVAPILDAIEHALDDVAGFVEVCGMLELNFRLLRGGMQGFASTSVSHSHK